MEVWKVSGLAALIAISSMSAGAFQPIPKESAKALGVTRGKPFSAGMVFVNGKYIEPPYTVERWGTGIRINSIPVTGQLIDWTDFMKTQADVKVERKEPVAVRPPEQPAGSEVSVSNEKSSLDELFDDDSKSEQAAVPPPASVAKPAVPVAAKPAKPAVSYSLSGAFVPNDDSKALLKRINDSRTELDRILRTGGFICFGDSYSRLTGDKRALMTLLDSLPEIQQRAESVDDFRARVRAAKLVFLNEVLCEELYRNRIDYRKLKERRERYRTAQKWDRVLDDVSDPIL